jgi:hypothetical protein
MTAMNEEPERPIREELRRLLATAKERRSYRPAGPGSPPPQAPSTGPGVGRPEPSGQKSETKSD